MIPVLQARWRLENRRLEYYGLPLSPLRRRIRVSRKTASILRQMNGQTPLEQLPQSRALARLIRRGVVVDRQQLQPPPQGWEDAHFCKNCCANDYMIPGLELDNNGLCPLCATASRYRCYKNVMPVMGTIPRNPDPYAKYDCAVLYTGGKDSSFLLYYLVKVCGLRVLALTWKTPFMSDSALQSMEHAKKALPDTTFLIQEAPPDELQKVYAAFYKQQGNTCLCPSVAYALFFELCCTERVPYWILGNEPVQCQNLIYNRMSPAFYFRPGVQKAAHILMNVGRLCRLRRPFSKGQMEMYMVVRNLAFPQNRILTWFGYRNALVDSTRTALQAGAFTAPFREAVKCAGRTGRMPALVHIDFDAISPGGVYHWDKVKQLLQDELGWVDAPTTGKGLHTSCQIERCKEYTQWTAFQDMRSPMIPFSAIELSLAVSAGSVSRKQALYELQHHTGFQNTPPQEMDIMLKVLRHTPEPVEDDSVSPTNTTV